MSLLRYTAPVRRGFDLLLKNATIDLSSLSASDRRIVSQTRDWMEQEVANQLAKDRIAEVSRAAPLPAPAPEIQSTFDNPLPDSPTHQPITNSPTIPD